LQEDDDSGASEDSDDSFAPKLQEDHALLLRVALPLLRSRNAGVVLAVATLHHYVGPRDRAILGRIGRALVRIMRGYREVTYIVLTNIVEFAKQSPEMFRKYLKDFYIAVRVPCGVAHLTANNIYLLFCRSQSQRSSDE
jgi:AP-3 complex subunit beta